MKRVEDAGLCAQCGGLCCLSAPGGFSPDDLTESGVLNASEINAALDSGVAIISTSFVNIEGHRAAPLLKINARGIGRGPLSLCHMPSQCAHLHGNHCAFLLEERPYECAVMVPHRDISRCGMHDGMPAEVLWVGHQGLLREVVSLRAGRPWFDELLAQMHSQLQVDEYAYGAWRLVQTIGLADNDPEIDSIVAAWKKTL